MSDITLKVVGLIQGTTDGNYSLLLEELKGERRLPILIGSFEAQAIALAIEKKELKRPLTHDLLAKFIELGSITLTELNIHSLIEGIFHAKLYYTNLDGKKESLNCRPSDGIVLALKFDLPIHVAKTLMDSYSILMDDPMVYEDTETEKPGRPDQDLKPQTGKSFEDILKEYTAEQLEKMLHDAESNEDYEKAVKIRDELNRR
jgi:bifunctional DNase/RNase